jgi:hypothetical protein
MAANCPTATVMITTACSRNGRSENRRAGASASAVAGDRSKTLARMRSRTTMARMTFSTRPSRKRVHGSHPSVRPLTRPKTRWVQKACHRGERSERR